MSDAADLSWINAHQLNHCHVSQVQTTLGMLNLTHTHNTDHSNLVAYICTILQSIVTSFISLSLSLSSLSLSLSLSLSVFL